MRRAGFEPIGAYAGSGAPWRARCIACGQEWTPRLVDIRRGTGCRSCADKRTGDLRRFDPDEAAEIARTAGVEPLVTYPGNTEPWLCRCIECGREVTPRFSDLRQGHGGCNFCRARKQSEKDRRERHDSRVEAMRAAGVEPLELYPGSAKRWRCRCNTCGEIVFPTYNVVQQGSRGCRACAIRAYSDTRRMDPDEAVAAMRAVGLEPLEPYPGSALAPWLSRCVECGREQRQPYASAQQGMRCRACAMRSFAGKSAFVYLIVNSDLGVVKVGIARLGSPRLRKFQNNGWELVREWHFADGLDAIETERRTLRWWRDDLGLPFAALPEEMPDGGHSETASLASVDLAAVVAFIDSLEVDA